MRLGAVRVRYGPWLDIVGRLNMRSRLVVFGAAAALALYVNTLHDLSRRHREDR